MEYRMVTELVTGLGQRLPFLQPFLEIVRANVERRLHAVLLEQGKGHFDLRRPGVIKAQAYSQLLAIRPGKRGGILGIGISFLNAHQDQNEKDFFLRLEELLVRTIDFRQKLPDGSYEGKRTSRIWLRLIIPVARLLGTTKKEKEKGVVR